MKIVSIKGNELDKIDLKPFLGHRFIGKIVDFSSNKSHAISKESPQAQVSNLRVDYELHVKFEAINPFEAYHVFSYQTFENLMHLREAEALLNKLKDEKNALLVVSEVIAIDGADITLYDPEITATDRTVEQITEDLHGK